MGHAAVLVRGPAAVPPDVRRDQHTLPTAGNGAPLGRKTLLSPADMIRLGEHIMPVSDLSARLGARLAPRRGARPASWRDVGQAVFAWHVLEVQEARQVRERAPQP